MVATDYKEKFNEEVKEFKSNKKKYKGMLNKRKYYHRKWYTLWISKKYHTMQTYLKRLSKVDKMKKKWEIRKSSVLYNRKLEKTKETKRSKIRNKAFSYAKNNLKYYKTLNKHIREAQNADKILRIQEDKEIALATKAVDSSDINAELAVNFNIDLSDFSSPKKILKRLKDLEEKDLERFRKIINRYNSMNADDEIYIGENDDHIDMASVAEKLSSIYNSAYKAVNSNIKKKIEKNRIKRKKEIEEMQKDLKFCEKRVSGVLAEKQMFLRDEYLREDFLEFEKEYKKIKRKNNISSALVSECGKKNIHEMEDPINQKKEIETVLIDYINSDNYEPEEEDKDTFSSIWRAILNFFGLSSDEKMPDSINKSINDKLERAVGGTPRTKDADEKNTPEQNAGRTNPALTLRDPKRPDVELSKDSEAQKPTKTTTPTSPSHAQEGSSQQQPQNPQSVQQPQNPQLGQQPQNSLLTQLLQQNPLLAQLVEQNPLLIQSLQKNPLLMQLLQQNLQLGQQLQNQQLGQQLQNPQLGQQLQNPQLGQQLQNQQLQNPQLGQQLQNPQLGQQLQNPQLGQQLQNPLLAQLLQQNLPYVPHVSYQPSLQHYGPCIDLNTYGTLASLLEQILYKLSAGSVNYNHPYASVPVPYSNRVLPSHHQLTFREFLEDKYGTPFPYRNLPFFDPVFLENNNNLALNNSLLFLNLIISEKIKSILGNDLTLAKLNQASNQLGPDNGFPLASLNQDQASNQLGPDNGFPLASLNQASNQLGPDNGFPLVNPKVSTDVHRVFNNEAVYIDKKIQTNEDTDEINCAIEDIMSFAEEQALKFASKEGEISTETKREIMHNLVKRANLSEDVANSIVNSDLINDSRVLDILTNDASYNNSKEILTMLSSINEDFGKMFLSELSI